MERIALFCAFGFFLPDNLRTNEIIHFECLVLALSTLYFDWIRGHLTLREIFTRTSWYNVITVLYLLGFLCGSLNTTSMQLLPALLLASISVWINMWTYFAARYFLHFYPQLRELHLSTQKPVYASDAFSGPAVCIVFLKVIPIAFSCLLMPKKWAASFIATALYNECII